MNDNLKYNNQDIFHDTDMIMPNSGYSLKSAFSFVGGKKLDNNKYNKSKISNSISEELNLDNLAIPPSLYYMEYAISPSYYFTNTYENINNEDDNQEHRDNDNENKDKIISDSLYDKLLLLAEDTSRRQKKYTKRNNQNDKNKKTNKRKTRRNK